MIKNFFQRGLKIYGILKPDSAFGVAPTESFWMEKVIAPKNMDGQLEKELKKGK